MLANNTQIGSTGSGTSFADIIINNVNSVAEGTIQGFAQFVHDPKALRDTVQMFSKQSQPKKFADAVIMRRVETQKLDDIWQFPLNMSAPVTCPMPWTIVEATVKAQQGSTDYEFNVMRTVDFVGRNYVRLMLPAVDCSQIVDSYADVDNDIASPEHLYLGAWHRDLIPRIIKAVEFYPRSNSHKLFEYSGYDIYTHNILFGNAKKEMNDLMAGEDKFELCYDPYRVDGSAMGIASFKGIDAFADYTAEAPDAEHGGKQTWTSNQKDVLGNTDGLFDYLQLDTNMDDEEFRTVYRRNVWYEAPVAKNYNARHSIHSRRLYHAKKDITVPLDILPFGYSIASSLPSAALSSECGFIKIRLYEDWLDRAFYLTKASDIPSIHPIVNHTHYAVNDRTPEGYLIESGDPREGWVNERSIGRFGDPTFDKATTAGSEGFESDNKFSQAGSVLGVPEGFNRRDNIVPTSIDFEDEGLSGKETMASKHGHIPIKAKAMLRTKGAFHGVVRKSTAQELSAYQRNTPLSDASGKTSFIHKMSDIDANAYNNISQQIGIKLLQVGYQTLPCIRECFSKQPNIYITTEWVDKEFSIDKTDFDINNDLYNEAIVLWFLPRDKNGIESMRVYPCHMVDHEMPIIPGIKLVNEQNQGDIVFDWSMLNVINPAQMNLNPLMENMGLISFSPTLSANQFPLAFYDSNVNGYIKASFLPAEHGGSGKIVNLKDGRFLVQSIGINGIAAVNLNLFRLIF